VEVGVGSNQVHAKYQSKRKVLPCYDDNPHARTGIVMKPTGRNPAQNYNLVIVELNKN
jgi:hypothetical protein